MAVAVAVAVAVVAAVVAVAKAAAPVVADDAAVAAAAVVVVVVVAAAVAAVVELRRAHLIWPGTPSGSSPEPGQPLLRWLALAGFMATQPAHARMPG